MCELHNVRLMIDISAVRPKWPDHSMDDDVSPWKVSLGEVRGRIAFLSNVRSSQTRLIFPR